MNTDLQCTTVLNTRPETGGFDAALREAGMNILHVPMLRFDIPETWDAVDAVLDDLQSFDGLLYTSALAVRFFSERATQRAVSPTRMPPVYAIGQKTTDALRGCGIEPAFLSTRAYAAAMAREIPDLAGKRFLQPCSDIAREDIVTAVNERGGKVRQIVTYRILPPTDDTVKRAQQLHNQQAFDCAAFFSPSAVRHFLDAVPEFRHDACVIASIGTTTADEIRSAGLNADIIAQEQSGESLARSIAEWYAQRSTQRRPCMKKQQSRIELRRDAKRSQMQKDT